MKILYVLDDDPSGLHTLEHVVTEARQCLADLVLLDVIDTRPGGDTQLSKPQPSQQKNSLLRERLARLESFVLMNGCDAEALRARVLFGERTHEIARTAAEGGFDLVIKHPEPGTTDRLLTQHCPCPVLLCAAPAQLTADTILDALSPPLPRQDKAVA